MTNKGIFATVLAVMVIGTMLVPASTLQAETAPEQSTLLPAPPALVSLGVYYIDIRSGIGQVLLYDRNQDQIGSVEVDKLEAHNGRVQLDVELNDETDWIEIVSEPVSGASSGVSYTSTSSSGESLTTQIEYGTKREGVVAVQSIQIDTEMKEDCTR